MEIDNVISEKMPKINDQLFTFKPLVDHEICPHKTVFINHLKLFNFKQILIKNNVPYELSKGVLWCYNHTICVRKNSSGKILMEGIISRNYYYIHSLLYKQFITI